MPSPEGPQVLTFSVPLGATLEITNRTRGPKSYAFDCGPYGTVEFVLGIGASLRFTPGLKPPRIVTDDVKGGPVEGDNVVQIDLDQ